jgi:asparagine synthase (glutamine-hydrolysing)
MCGFTGFNSSSNELTQDDWSALLQCMGDTIVYRDADDSGVWCDKEAGVGFEHRCVSVFDLLPAAGHHTSFPRQGVMSSLLMEKFTIIYRSR